ncbi:glucose-1-phosphate thymidylyltransferase [Bacillus safensis]|nr:glucose-1-phosphate thymidylyltransferase [Bacillus safensis]
MKGIILAGGSGTRLYPLTKIISKQLLPIYDKPMIYYPLSVLMMAGIRDILFISSPHDISKFEQLFGDGSQFGLHFEYKVQQKPSGIAEALIIGEEFIGKDQVTMILGDNIFYGHQLIEKIKISHKYKKGATIFAYKVSDPARFGVVNFDVNHRVLSIEEKPKKPQSSYAITGLYIFDHQSVCFAKQLKPSKRGELEITDIHNQYLAINQLNLQLLGRGHVWLDAGTHSSLLEASQFIETIETRQNLKIACLEEIAYNENYISKNELEKMTNEYSNNSYKEYLQSLIEEY